MTDTVTPPDEDVRPATTETSEASQANEPPRRLDPLAAMRRWWWLSLVLALLGTGAGLFVAQQEPVLYTAEARLTVGNNSLSNYQVAGFASASEAMAANYARYVSDSSTTQEALSNALDSRVDEVRLVTASPIPDSNVIRVEAVSADAGVAQTAAQAIARSLVRQTRPDTEAEQQTLIENHTSFTEQVLAQEQVVNDLTGAGQPQRLQAAQAELSTLRMQQTAAAVAYQQSITQATPTSGLNIIQASSVASNNRRSTLQIGGLVGLFAGLGVGLVVANLLGDRRRRSRA